MPFFYFCFLLSLFYHHHPQLQMPASTLILHNKTWNLHQKLSSIRIAVIETNLKVSGHACTVSNLRIGHLNLHTDSQIRSFISCSKTI